MSLDARWRAHLDALGRAGRLRQLTPPAGIDFSSNDYLGYAKLAWPPATGARGGTASRLLRGHDPIWDEVESRLARWHGAEAALVLTSGYVANEGLLSTLIEPQDFVASDALNHASLIDGLRLSKAERFIYRHTDLDHLEAGLRAGAHGRSAQRQSFIVTESLFGMEGDRAPLAGLADLARRYDAHLLVDEAHATGCFGRTGSGLVDELRLRPQVLASVHTGGKTLGVPGAYVVGSRLLKELLVNRCRHLIFTTALPPLIGQWWLDALDHVIADELARAALHGAARRFRQMLRDQGISPVGHDFIVPLVLGDDARAVAAARQLQVAGFDVRAIRPPTVPPGTARLRMSIHADHDADTLGRLADALGHILHDCPTAHHVA
jgi:8-amino-7-oxononanoate synthase